MDEPPDLATLHDAVLATVNVDWEEAQARVRLLAIGGGEVILTVFGVTEFTMTHEQPWGPSIYVNRAAATEDGPGRIAVWIEMQSGDEIRLTGGRLQSTGV